MSFKDAFQSQEAETGGGSLIEKGEYDAEITDVSLDMTKEPSRLTIEYTITSEPYAGRKQWGNYQLEGRGIGFLKKDLTTLGLDYSQIDSPEAIMELVGAAIGTQVAIFVNQKEYNGKIYNNPYLNALIDAPAATMPAPVNKKEDDRRAAKAPATKASGKAPAKKAPPKRQQEPNFEDTDEPPF